jgi:hypothetical protein
VTFDCRGCGGRCTENGEGAADEAHAVIASHCLCSLFRFNSMSRRWACGGRFAMHKTSVQPCNESRPGRLSADRACNRAGRAAPPRPALQSALGGESVSLRWRRAVRALRRARGP